MIQALSIIPGVQTTASSGYPFMPQVDKTFGDAKNILLDVFDRHCDKNGMPIDGIGFSLQTIFFVLLGDSPDISEALKIIKSTDLGDENEKVKKAFIILKKLSRCHNIPSPSATPSEETTQISKEHKTTTSPQKITKLTIKDLRIIDRQEVSAWALSKDPVSRTEGIGTNEIVWVAQE